PDLFGLTTASRLQRALCRVIAGYPLDGSVNPCTEAPPAFQRLLDRSELDDTFGREQALTFLRVQEEDRLAIVGEDLTQDPAVLEAFGGKEPCVGVKELMVVAAIRCAKTLMGAAALAQRAVTADLTGLREGETARAGICSWRVDLANTCFEFITAAFASSTLLRSQIIEPPKWYPGAPKNIIRVYNAVSDRNVDILTLTANRGGASALSKWYVGFVVDEAARMLADFQEGVINYQDIRRAVFQRIRPDGFYLAITSPWLSVGPVYEAQKKLGEHEKHGLCVAWAPGWAMNPITWTPEACERAKREDPESYETDVAARFARTDDLALSNELVKSVPKVLVRDVDDEPLSLAEVAVLDAGLRKEAVALAIAAMVRGRRTLLVYREWVGTADEPLRMRAVAREVARWLRRYNVSTVVADPLSQESLGELFEHEEVSVTGWEASARDFAAMSTRLEHFMRLGEVALVDDERVRDDLSSIRRVLNATGDVSVAFPLSTTLRASTSSRAVLYAMAQLYRAPEEERVVEMTEEKRMREAKLRRIERLENPLSGRDADVDEVLARYDAMGVLYG
ncbi:MAG TPA: hypothetical protein VLI21_14755, partial [Casimicrobiaceae bacterium]|nr:hypothetical protein [Casimicrobiaceae bacterium]